MSIREDIQDAMKEAMRAKDTATLDTLRMAKGALLLKEKESSKKMTEEDAVAALRAEVKKRQQSIAIFREHGREDAAMATEAEIEVIERFLPKQLSREQLVEKAKAYLAEHPEISHAGKLTGALKKELGDSADGRLLNEVSNEILANR